MPVYHRGELVGTRRAYDERLTIFLLSGRNVSQVPIEPASRTARNEWSGYFAELLIKVRSGEQLPDLAAQNAEDMDDIIEQMIRAEADEDAEFS